MGVIFIGLIVITIGLGALKLLSLLVNAILGRRKPQPSTKVGAWSGVVTALAVTATVFVGLAIVAVVAMVFYVKTESTGHAVTLNHGEQSDHIYVHSGSFLSSATASVDLSEQPGPIDVPAESTLSGATVTFGHPEQPIRLESIDMTRIRGLANQAELQQTHQAAELLAEAAEAAADEADMVNVLVTTTDTQPDSKAEQAAFIEANKAELDQLVSKIGQYVSSNLENIDDQVGAAVLGQAAKSDNGDVVVIQPSDEMVRQILGVAGQDLLKSFNSRLPGRINQTYALIPLTPPVGSSVAVNPLLAAGGLKMIANSIVAFVDSVESAAALAGPVVPTAESPAEAASELTVQPENPARPKWMDEKDGRRIVVETKPILSGDDGEVLLTVAINEALGAHVQNVTATMNSTLHEQANFVCLQLPQATARKFVVDTYDRKESLETETEGPQEFKIRYALLEFPEAVDQLAVRQIRQSIQQDRIFGLGIVVGLAWLSVCSAGIGIRQWRKGTRMRRFAAAPVFAVIALPTLLAAVGMAIALSRGAVLHRPWDSQPVSIDFQNM